MGKATVVVTAIYNRTKETITIPHQQRGPISIEPGGTLEGPLLPGLRGGEAPRGDLHPADRGALGGADVARSQALRTGRGYRRVGRASRTLPSSRSSSATSSGR
jgi:hypothetical protein